MIGLGQRHHVRVGPGHDRAGHVHGVARIGRQHDVAGVDEREGDVADPVLRAEGRQNLGAGIQLHARALAVPAGDRLSELGEAEIRRVAVVGRVGRHFLEHADDAAWRRKVRVPDAKRNDVDTRPLLLLHLAVDLGEEIWRYATKSLGAGDRFAHDWSLT